MSTMRNARRAAGVALLSWLAAGAARAAAGPSLLYEEASGAVPVTDETRVTVERVRGAIEVVGGDAGQLGYSSEMGGKVKAPLPVALWQEQGGFRIVPPAGAREMPGVLRLWVPPGMKVVLNLDGAAMTVAGVEGSVEVHGKGGRLDATGVRGSLIAELDAGTVKVSRSGGDVTVRGRDLEASVDGAAGAVALRISGGSATVTGAREGVDGDLDAVDLKVDGAQGFCRLRVHGGRADVAGLGSGAELSLAGAPLKLEKSKGPISIETDREVQFRDLESALRVTVFAGAVRGSVNKGSMEVKSTGAEAVAVEVQSVSGAVSVEGAGLRTRVSDVGAEVTVRTSSAPIQVDNATGPVTLETDNGEILAGRIFSEVKVKSGGGDVRLTDLNGPVNVQADGGQVEVAWVSLPNTKDSSITNEGGGVSVRFPQAGGCLVQARTTNGRVEVEGLPRVVVNDDRSQAYGMVGHMNRPLLKIVASGDVRLVGAAAAEQDQP
jgi:DUF4097 and DUF4098 domain-containing protein YvlB